MSVLSRMGLFLNSGLSTVWGIRTYILESAPIIYYKDLMVASFRRSILGCGDLGR